jgi:hypothetical protein
VKFSALNMKWPAWAAAGAALLLAACAQGRIVKVTSEPAPEFSAARGEEWSHADALWERRGNSEAAWSALVAYRLAVEEQPDAAELWTRYARACSFVATYTEGREAWSNPERRRGLYQEGVRAAETALRLHPGYARALAETGDDIAAMGTLQGRWLEPAFYLAVNRVRQSLAEDARARVTDRARLEAYMRALSARNGSILYGGPHRFMGVMFIAAPRGEGRNLDSARAHFARAQRIAPLYFANHTLRAAYLSTMERDTASFRELLEWVVATPADTFPEAATENAFEQARARELLARQAELFP